MMYLIGQTWLFLTIAWLIGVAVGFAYARDQRSQRHRQVEEELRDARRAVAQQKGELDRHLKDMRDWYKKKLRELAVQNREIASI